jgi:uncharacterized protein YcfJ
MMMMGKTTGEVEGENGKGAGRWGWEGAHRTRNHRQRRTSSEIEEACNRVYPASNRIVEKRGKLSASFVV